MIAKIDKLGACENCGMVSKCLRVEGGQRDRDRVLNLHVASLWFNCICVLVTVKHRDCNIPVYSVLW